MTAKVSLEEVLRVAELANLDLAENETPRMQRDLNAILDYVAELGKLDTTGIEPMAQVGDLLASDQPDSLRDSGDGSLLRSDQLRPSVDRTQVMSQAPESDGVFFKTPKVIER